MVFSQLLLIKLEDDSPCMTRSTNTGLAPGDQMSPLLFNLITHSICNDLRNVCISQYADDFVLFTSDKNLCNTGKTIQNLINKNW